MEYCHTSEMPHICTKECLQIEFGNVYKPILECLQSRKHCKAIMDDLLLFTPLKRAHMAKLEDPLKVLIKNGLKIPPKKCQLFKRDLQYMDNIIFIKDRKVCIKPLKSRLEATH